MMSSSEDEQFDKEIEDENDEELEDENDEESDNEDDEEIDESEGEVETNDDNNDALKQGKIMDYTLI